jgi:glycosyltransferase involved in cell wall biosynthesis
MRIIHTVSSLKMGGMEHFVLRLAAAQRRDGHAVTVLALQGGPLEREARKRGVRVLVPGGRGKTTRALRAAFTFARLGPHLINAHNQTSLHYAVLGKRVSGAKVVLTNHGQGKGSPRDPGGLEWRLTDAIVTVSRAVAERMDARALGARITTIHNGVEIPAAGRPRTETRAELGLPTERVVGIIAARIDHLKGHDTLLRALALLRKRRMPANLTVLIAGDGVERASREALARELGLGPDEVRFLGFRSDVADLLAASDIFVLPSLTEGLPLSVLEAMAHRLPTVATPVGGIPELITQGGNGLLVPVNHPRALADALATLAANAPLRRCYGEAAFQCVNAEFSFERMVDKYEALYHGLTAMRRAPHRRPAEQAGT